MQKYYGAIADLSVHGCGLEFGVHDSYYRSHEVDSALSEKDRRIAALERLQAAVIDHNSDMQVACNYLKATGRCDPYEKRGRSCPDCPCEHRIFVQEF